MRGLKVEAAADQSFILPFEQFLFSELKTDGTDQLLKLSFSTHEVSLRGNGLKRLESAVHRMELASVSALPERFKSTAGAGHPFIREVRVVAAQNPEKEPSA